MEGRLAPARPPPCTGGMQDCRTHASFTPSSGWIQQHCQHVSLYVEANVLELMGASAKCPYHLGVPCYKYIVENPKTLFQLSRSLYISKCEKTHQVFLHPTQQARSVYHTVCWKILKRTLHVKTSDLTKEHPLQNTTGTTYNSVSHLNGTICSRC